MIFRRTRFENLATLTINILTILILQLSFLCSSVLSGPGVEAEHCIMESIEGTVILHPIASLCQVNGLPVGKSQRISQGRCTLHLLDLY